MNFIEELKWRGLFHQEIPGTEELLNKGDVVRGYIGFDPTAPSLGIGNLVQIIILKHFQRAGHQPIAVLGGATGMVGDPSGKSAERNLQTVDQLNTNKANVEAQLRHFLDFDAEKNPTILVDNYDFYKDMNVLTFLRDVGKHLTVNYMLAKDAVKSRMETGISYTEFSYQLLQAYDFVQLYKQYNCLLQLGGSDQWGNLVSGVELIRRMEGGEVYAATTPLVTKTDGTKFGKSEKGNIFLSADMTSPYQFYQFWLNVSDADAEKFIKIFTFLDRPTIESLIEEHRQDPGRNNLQKCLAAEVTRMVHGELELEKAIYTSGILFMNDPLETLQSLSKEDLLSLFDEDKQFIFSKDALAEDLSLVDFLSDSAVFSSKSEVRRAIKGNALAVNGKKITDEKATISPADLNNDTWVWVQNGRKKHLLVLTKKTNPQILAWAENLIGKDREHRVKIIDDIRNQIHSVSYKELIETYKISGKSKKGIAKYIRLVCTAGIYSLTTSMKNDENGEDLLHFTMEALKDPSSLVRYRAIELVQGNSLGQILLKMSETDESAAVQELAKSKL